MSPEAIILEQQYERKMKKKLENTIKVTITDSESKYSFEVGDDATWKKVLDKFINLLNASGYYITYSKIEEWVNETDARYYNEILES